MTFTILHKRSNVASHVPNTTQLALGEVAVNTYDGLLYFVKQQNSTNTVQTVSPLPPSITLTGGVTGSANFSGANAITITTSVLTAITQPAGDSTTNVATTAFVAGAYLPVSGGTMTGDFTVANAASNANAGATRLHVDASVNGVVTSRVSLVATESGGSAIDIFGPAPTGIQAFSSISPSSQIWLIELNTGAATGNNTGDNYTITAYDDTGVPMPITAQTIYRSNSVTVFGNTIVTVTQPNGDNTTNVATTAFVQNTVGNFLPVTLSGDATGTGSTSILVTLASVGSAGTWTQVQTDGKGRVTSGQNPSISYSGDVSGTATLGTNVTLNLANNNSAGLGTYTCLTVNAKGIVTYATQMIASGDATGTVSAGTLPLTLATVNGNVGSFGGATVVPAMTVNAKGLVTAVTATNIAFPVTSVGGSTGVVTGGTFSSLVSHTGQVTAVTQPSTDNSSNVATTAFVKSANATQISRYVTGTIGTSSGTYTITPSNAVPASPFTGWGTLWTASITPTSTSSKIRIRFNISFSVSIARTMLFLITRGTTVIGMAGQYGATTLQMFSHSMDVIDSPATTSSTTYTCYYAGQVTAGTVYWNQQGGSTAYTYGSAMTSSYSLQDV